MNFRSLGQTAGAFLIAGALALTTSACSVPSSLSSSESAASEELHSAGGAVSDAELAAMVRRAPDPLTSDYRMRLMQAALEPTVTTARLKMLNELAAGGLDRYQAHDGKPDPRQDAYGDLASQIQVAYCVAPRDMAPIQHGQTLHTSLDGSALAGPVTVKVTGTATVDYRLEFTMSNHRLNAVLIPAGSTAEATAKRISDAINAEKEAIETDFFEEHGIGPDTGEYGGSDGMYSTVSGDTVTIDPAING
jgi:hypothetical protein